MNKITILILISIIFAGCSSQPPEAAAIQTAITETQGIGAIISSPTRATTNTKTMLAVTETLPPTYTPVPTKTLRPTQTPGPTKTKIPTLTERPSPTVTSLRPAETRIADFLFVIKLGIGAMLDIESVNMVRLSGPKLEVEVKTQYFAQDRQPDIAYSIIKQIAIFAATREDFERISGLSDISVSLTTYSSGGNYVYYSLTDLDTLILVSNQKISFEEWKIAARAMFK